MIDHGIRVLLVYEAGFRDPQCQKLFVNLSLPCRYRNSCPFESGFGPLDMYVRYRLHRNYESLTVNRKKIDISHKIQSGCKQPFPIFLRQLI